MSISSAQWGASYNSLVAEYTFLEDVVREAVANRLDKPGLSNASVELVKFSDSLGQLKNQLIKVEGTMKKSEYEENKSLLAGLLEKEAKLKLLISKAQSQNAGLPQREFGPAKDLSPSEIKQQQLKAIEYQDKGIDNLLSAIKSQKNMALGIGNEIESQNRLLDTITDKVGGTHAKVHGHTGLVSNVIKTSGKTIYYVIIALLIIGIIAVVASPKP
ncbi:hypothetical protein RF11_09472 [Thelohanellus kitauei]|uniref:t-SNARE coiled-coil homology domain-containing protein n=1 Tax=Thelohanellus kitauei TaxID=669202 RepID=A0A0C2MFW0_THEKT|nr:hypothetical protein RF11_09472 [Thelohanellus kitauei]